jgi:exosome complex RNA-binding protein Csl4
MSAQEWKREATAVVGSIEDLRGRLAQVTKLFADKASAFESMRASNLDLVRRLSEAVAVQMVLRARVLELERELADLRGRRVH